MNARKNSRKLALMKTIAIDKEEQFTLPAKDGGAIVITPIF
jgi:hypothetical protein